MPFQQLLLIVWAHRKAAVWVFLVVAAATTLATLLMPRQYVATASLVFDFRADPVAGVIVPGMGQPGFVATQMDIIQSDRVANRAVRLLRLDQDPEAVQAWQDDTGGRTPIESYYGQMLLARLAVKPGRGSNVISLSYTGSDAQFATAAANAFAQAFVDVNVELRVEPARQYASWFDERLKTLRGDLERAQSRLSSFQQAKGIVATEERLDQELARLASLTTQLAETEGQKADRASREHNSGSESSPDVLDNPMVQNIKTDIAKTEARLAELSSVFGQNHPQVRQQEAQLAGLRQLLRTEIQRIAGGAAAASRVSSLKVEELQKLIKAQKERVLQLRAERDAMAILVRDVESAQHAYEAVAQRSSLTNLESQMQHNNASILSPAIEPDAPAKPKVAMNILAGIAAGLLLGVGAAIGLEKLDRRVRLAEDLAGIEAVPLLAVLQPKPRRNGLREMIGLARARLQRRPPHPPRIAAAGGR